MMRFRRLRLMIDGRTVCRMRSGLQILHFRDGQQSRAPYSTEQIVMYDYLHKLGGSKGKSVRVNSSCTAKKTGTQFINVWKRVINFRKLQVGSVPIRKDFELVKEIGLKETGILVSCSIIIFFYKMKMTRKEGYGPLSVGCP